MIYLEKTCVMDSIINATKPLIATILAIKLGGIFSFINDNISTIAIYMSIGYTGFKFFQDLYKAITGKEFSLPKKNKEENGSK